MKFLVTQTTQIIKVVTTTAIPIFRHGKYVLLFSEKSFQQNGANRIINNDGDEVLYSCMGKDYRSYWGWDDTVIVGFADSCSQITELNIRPVVCRARCCGICQSIADKYDFGFVCRANKRHWGDLNVGIFSDLGDK